MTAVSPIPLPFSLSQALSVAVVVLGSLLVAAAVVTVGYSLRAARKRRRRVPMRAELRAALLDRLYGRDDPAWDDWVADLSSAERDELESLLDVYLRQLEGGDADALAALGAALNLAERSRCEITTGDYWDRLHALRWLALLRDAPDRDLLEVHCTDTPRERAAAARVLYAAATDDCATTGVDLLLRDHPSAFSVFGVDTLYRVAEGNPKPFFERAAADFDGWEPALQRQVLLVVRNLTTVVGGVDLSWVVAALSNPDPSVRAAAWRALGAYGWNQQLRDAIDLDLIPDDPDPTVRADAYRALGVWGDTEAVAAIESATWSERDARAQVAAARTLVTQRTPDQHLTPGQRAPPRSQDDSLAADADASFDIAWTWAAEHTRFDRLARDISRDRDRIYEGLRG